MHLAAGLAGGAWWAAIEFNPARVVDPHGWEPCPVSELRRATELVWQGVLRLVETHSDPGPAKVKRVDVTRDFFVADPALYIWGLQSLHRPYATHNMLFADPKTGTPEGLSVGTETGGRVVIYDKGPESSAAPRGTLRWETQTTGWAKRYGGISSANDLDEDHIVTLGLDRFEWSRAGAAVLRLPAAVAAAVRTTGNLQDAGLLIGVRVLRRYGYEPGPLPRRLAPLDAGLAIGQGRADEATPASARLDLVAGTEVTAA